MSAYQKDQLSSSKCDFKFAFGNLNFQGRQMMQSSKCDWKISAAGDKVFTSLEQSPFSKRLVGQFDNFNGLVGSDKCDYHISIKDPRMAMRIDSDKCDWRISSRTDRYSLRSVQGPGFFDVKGEINKVASRMNSDKCDYRIELRGIDARAMVSSDKCDWSMLANNRRVILEALASQQNFSISSKGLGISSRAQSDKCDFSISSRSEVVLPMRLDAQTPRMKMNMSSSKCDWRIQALNVSTLNKTPVFGARMSTSKCDFMIDIEFGMLGGKPIQISAVSSSKCDFRLIGKYQERFEQK